MYVFDPWNMSPLDKGGQIGMERNKHLCGVFTQGIEVSEMPGDGMPGSSA